MTGTSAACLHKNQSRSYLNHLVLDSTQQNKYIEKLKEETRNYK
jgi:hypothetical protein